MDSISLPAAGEPELTGVMLVVCAWCKPQRQIGTKPCAALFNGAISHGICPTCSAEVLVDLNVTRKLVEIAPEAPAP